MKTIYLVRHAHSEYTPDERGRPLSASGMKDAEQVKQQLAGKGITEIWSSPYRRAIQTVEGLSISLGIPLRLEEGFRERLLSSQPVNDFAAAVKQLWQNPDTALPGGESNHNAAARALDAMARLLGSSAAEVIAVATHGNLMALILNAFDSSYGYEFWENLTMPDIYRLRFSDSSGFQGADRIWTT